MDITLVINPGSSSKKYALFRDGKAVLEVLFEHTEEGYGKCIEINGERQRCEDVPASAYGAALGETIGIARREGLITDVRDISRVGIRVVSPGTYFERHRSIDEDYIRLLKAMAAVAPLHIPHTVSELDAAMKIIPHARLVGVSDSAFHSTMPSYARTYSIPTRDSKAYDVYRFGYHGISVASVVRQAREEEGGFPSRAIVCHLGSGVSVTALRDGKSIDTSMGFAPGDGLMMGTRSGDIDPGALLHLMKAKNLNAAEGEAYINEEGGFKGLLGQNDLRIALDRRARGDVSAEEAFEIFTYNIKKTIGSFAAVLGGLDLLILTATAAERNPTIRSLVCAGLEQVGIQIDAKMNDSLMARPGLISHEESAVKVLVLHTDEMFEMALVTQDIVN
jgi:acetate kinase